MRRIALAALVVASGVISGCGHTSFRQDDRLHIVSPAAESSVHLPLTVKWSSPDAPPGGAFAVFVDASVPPPGVSLRSHFANQDHKCELVATCPDAAYLAAVNVFVTSDDSVVVTRVAHAGSKGPARIHRATIVMLDAEGRRIGDAAWSVPFTVASAATGART